MGKIQAHESVRRHARLQILQAVSLPQLYFALHHLAFCFCGITVDCRPPSDADVIITACRRHIRILSQLCWPTTIKSYFYTYILGEECATRQALKAVTTYLSTYFKSFASFFFTAIWPWPRNETRGRREGKSPISRHRLFRPRGVKHTVCTLIIHSRCSPFSAPGLQLQAHRCMGHRLEKNSRGSFRVTL